MASDVAPSLTAAHLDEIAYWKEDAEDGDPILTAEWTLELVEIAAFGMTFDRRKELPRYGWTGEGEDARDQFILDWVDDAGGWDAALLESPVVALVSGGRLEKVDGWHRMKLAQAAGQTAVWCLVGRVKPDLEG